MLQQRVPELSHGLASFFSLSPRRLLYVVAPLLLQTSHCIGNSFGGLSRHQTWSLICFLLWFARDLQREKRLPLEKFYAISLSNTRQNSFSQGNALSTSFFFIQKTYSNFLTSSKICALRKSFPHPVVGKLQSLGGYLNGCFIRLMSTGQRKDLAMEFKIITGTTSILNSATCHLLIYFKTQASHV